MASPYPLGTRQLVALRADPDAKLARQEQLGEIEDAIFERSLSVIDATIGFADIEPNQETPPPQWVEQYGQEAAERRLRIARMAWLPKSQAPAGQELAMRYVAGYTRARGMKISATQNNLNVTIALPAPTSSHAGAPPQFPEKDIE
jgi:hypothetical protein